MGDIVVGDTVFDDNGMSSTVLCAFPVEENPKSYRIIFDDGSEILAGTEHKWLTYDAKELAQTTRLNPAWREKRRLGRASKKSGNKSEEFSEGITARNKQRVHEFLLPPAGTVRTTQEIAETLHTASGRKNHAIPVSRALELPELDLPIPPYVLGAWLGDGSKTGGGFTGIDPEIWEEIKKSGYKVTHGRDTKSHHILGLVPGLRRVGVFRNKHIPPVYFRSSAAQRLFLLQGLMDTDGTVCASGSVEFTNTNLDIANGVYELIVSLGWKARVVEGRAKLYGKDCGAVYNIKWTPSDYVFRLPRKREKQKLAERRTTKFRYIAACNEILPVPMRCISVDSPSHLYLAGQAMIPTHNSDLLLGLAGTAHLHSLIMRRVYPSLRGTMERSREIFNASGEAGSRDSYNQTVHLWRLRTGRIIEFGSMQHEKDKENYRGRPHDFYGWDEVSEFSESQFRFVNTWNRTTRPGQRYRVVATGNPPTNVDGEWVIRYWAPWLDSQHPNPAKPGQLRWFARVDDADVELETGDAIENNGETIVPRSRTFIPARLSDNPLLEATGYGAVLQGLPEPLRSQLLYGDFTVGVKDNAYQVIPTEWVRAAMARWDFQPQPDLPQSAIGVDVASGGRDKTVIVIRRGTWIAPLRKFDGAETPDGATTAAKVIEVVQGAPFVNVDPIGYGSSAYERLRDVFHMQVNGVNFAETARGTDRTGSLQFANVRAEAFWNLRELLDPQNNSDVCLPNDNELLVDLTCMRWDLRAGKILIESKEDIKGRIGRSPDCGDAVALAFYGIGAVPSQAMAIASPKARSKFTRDATLSGGRWRR